MNSRDYDARPFFKTLAGLLAVLSWSTIIMFVSLWLLSDLDPVTRWLGYTGVTSVAIIMTMTAFRMAEK